MAATHKYVVSAYTAPIGAITGTVTGTVDTIPSTGAIAVAVSFSISTALNILNTAGGAAVVGYIAPIMLSQAIHNGLATPAAVTVPNFPTSFTYGTDSYVISSATYIGDKATIIGTVDGTSCTIILSESNIQAIYEISGTTALEAYIAPIMLAAAYANGLAQPNVSGFSIGTFNY